MVDRRSSAAASWCVSPTVCHAMLSLVAGMEKLLLAVLSPSCFGWLVGVAGLVNDLGISFVREFRVSSIWLVSKSPEMEMNAFSVV